MTGEVAAGEAVAGGMPVGERSPDAGLIDTGLVDVHTHAIAPWLPDLASRDGWRGWPCVQRLGDTRARILVGGRPYRDIDDRCWSARRRLADMDAEGVAVQVLSPIPITFCHDAPAGGAAVLARSQNDFLASLVAEYPRRFRALGAVPLQDPAAAVTELYRCVRELGFLGVEIGTRVGQAELGDPEFDPFFAAAGELGALVLVHPADSTLDPRLARLGVGFGAGMPSETGIAIAGLLTGGAPARRPGLRLCLAHGGGCLPWLLPRLDRGRLISDPALPADQLPSALARSFYSDSLTYDVDSLLLAVARFGAEHVLLGTDYPFAARESPAGAVLAGPHERLTAGLRAAIGRQNALELIGLDRRLVPTGRPGEPKE
ncbi:MULTISPECIES: amidohydrolase family protein [Protofrankia]|uniref:2-amino-3-carboxymuconate-6-semialdehyde decarboxylase n=1 Tax=Candidatus Protofrankia datiscae TaxID=2716812 RepID=F8B4B9_9ACTN|nr:MULTISPECIES: amidohydrolase family protein [Protofrankia]AEH09455.1 Aminocarboxymuconate-semialdehyde decarboxylase [Candidatus Protofrankia datiscae]